MMLFLLLWCSVIAWWHGYLGWCWILTGMAFVVALIDDNLSMIRSRIGERHAPSHRRSPDRQ